jgi:hypothetical protein
LRRFSIRRQAFMKVFGGHSICLKALGDLDQVLQRSAETIETPHDNGVAAACMAQKLGKHWTIGRCAERSLGERALTAGRIQRVELQPGRLIVRRNPRITDEQVAELISTPLYATEILRQLSRPSTATRRWLVAKTVVRRGGGGVASGPLAD